MAGLRGSIWRDGELVRLVVGERSFRVERIEDGQTYRLQSGSTVYRTQRHASEPDFLFLVRDRGAAYRPVELGRLWLTDAAGPLRMTDLRPARRAGVQAFATGSVR